MNEELRVKCYWNLHKNTYSVVAMEGERKGRVVSHEDSIHLEDVFFKVSESGRQRVLRDRVKNVHAYVVGTLVLDREKLRSFGKCDRRVTYNPYVQGNFFARKDREVVHEALRAYLGVLVDVSDERVVKKADIRIRMNRGE